MGPWRVQPATHKVTNKRVSVWTYDKRAADADRMNAAAKDRITEALKVEVREACCAICGLVAQASIGNRSRTAPTS